MTTCQTMSSSTPRYLAERGETPVTAGGGPVQTIANERIAGCGGDAGDETRFRHDAVGDDPYRGGRGGTCRAPRFNRRVRPDDRLIRQSFCDHVHVLQEVASLVFGGGFPRDNHDLCRRAAQRAIFHVQSELENAADAHLPAIVLCDRGTLDGLAYWPGTAKDFWSSLRTTQGEQLANYHAVIHLRTPAAELGYNRQNPLRTESPTAAAEIDARILQAWQGHPRRFVVESSAQFLDRAAQALRILRDEMPECCRHHVIPALSDHLHRASSNQAPSADSSRLA